MTRLTTCPDAESVATRAAEHVARHLERALQERGSAHLALSGGTTPRRAYELLAEADLDWKNVSVWFADERCVGPDDEQSNYRLAVETLLRGAAGGAGGRAGIPKTQVHRMRGELGPDEGARRYAEELAAGGPPVLDVIVLGIGPDGHVASLFPGAPTLDAPEDALCLGVRDSPKPPPERLTLSLAVLRAAHGCVLLATDASKSDAVTAMLGEPTRDVPASLLRRERLTVIVDDAAAPHGPRP